MNGLHDTETLVTMRDFIRWGASRFNDARLCFGHGTDNALDEALLLVLHALHLPVDCAPTYLDSRLTPSERQAVAALLRRRIEQRAPAAYLTGEAWFSGLPFYVNEHVLVPRSPLAELIERDFAPWIDGTGVSRVLDLCTGSGCVGIACALHMPHAQVDLVDVSERALAVAEKNQARHELEGRVRAIRSDLFESLVGQRYDIIVSNPPYVCRDELSGLPLEFLKEPVLGLDGGADGLMIVKRILREASSHLQPGGIIVIEVGSSAEALIARYPRVPFLWLDFERGGDGVFLLTAEQVNDCKNLFN